MSPVTAVASGSGDQVLLSAGQDKALLLHSLSSSHSVQNTVNLTSTDTADQVDMLHIHISTVLIYNKYA